MSAVRAAGRGDYLDGVVFAYRLYPSLITSVKHDAEANMLISKALTLARDHELARREDVRLNPEHIDDPLQSLTRREREVLGLLSQGMTNADIARCLFIEVSTAKVHVRHILDKLGARNRLEAVIKAREALGLEDD
ncbi:MAG TPA: helix-turn-helix transcriptional regulator [Candidatus Paceibacterota bacterium]|nr:helix-turn-helix transcriptional regulator [Candidatus Paceibacterota bacterium]